MIPKFRAWHIHKQIICEVIRIDFKQGIVTLDLEPDDDEYYWTETDWKTSHVIIMQSTGLEDKNGVEIYDGDILDIKANFKRLGFVIFDHGKFKVQHVEDTAFYDFTQVLSHCEVIGNIHENKELLEAMK